MPREELTERRDRALRDLVELQRQQHEGEISDSAAARLRDRYELEAAAALAALDSLQNDGSTLVRSSRRPSRATIAAYTLTGIAAAVALAALPGNVGRRPSGGFVTGNMLNGQRASSTLPAKPPTVRDLSKVTDAELEAVIRANPGIVEMRLALAQRYSREGQDKRAIGQFGEALRLEPRNPEALAHLGWSLLQLGLPQEALIVVRQARAVDPRLLDGLWFEANIRLFGLADPRGALVVLEDMRSHRLKPEVNRQIDALSATARSRLAAQQGPTR